MYDSEKASAAPLVGSFQAEYNLNSGPGSKRPHTPSTPPIFGLRDPVFLVLFLANLGFIFFYAFTKGLDSFNSASSSSSSSFSVDEDTRSFFYAVLGLCAVAGVLGGLALTVLMRNAESLIRFTLYFNIGICVAIGLYCMSVQPILGVLMLLVAMLNWCYMRAVQKRIPFASANLKVACAAVRTHFSVVAVSYLIVILCNAYIFVWCLAAYGAIDAYNDSVSTDEDSSADDEDDSDPSASWGVLFFFLSLSLYWGSEVLKNISHVTTAGTIATWWYNDQSVTSAVSGSFCRATTSSLGSIAFGSLIVAFLQVLEDMARKGERDGNVLACIARCLIQCFKNVAEYFNRWAFVYVGIYGDSFINSGKAVCALFKNRGWTTFINDNLISRTLSLLALAVGVLVGGVGAGIGTLPAFDYLEYSEWILFAVGLFVGLFLTLIMVSVVDSAVATVFVCFAESPQVFEQTHPALYYDLTASWREAHNVVF